MNAPVRQLEPNAPYRFTWDEVMRMSEAGLFDRDDGWRVELIEGELIAVSPQSMPHLRVKAWLNRLFVEALPAEEWVIIPDGPLAPSEFSGPEPDLFIYSRGVIDEPLNGADVVLAVEVSLSTLTYDLKRKPSLYAQRDVQEYWVVDVAAKQLVIHTNPGNDQYADVRRTGVGERVSPAALPQVVVNLAEMP